MKQRFVVTLLAVAIASLSASAYAVAPVISDFRSPIIGDDTPITGSNFFVYPDVFDLDQKASDPDGTVTPANIIWSFMEQDGIYQINARQSMNLGLGDNPNAPGVKGVGVTGQDDTSGSLDSNVRTITFRNVNLSPVGGPNVEPAGPNGILDGTSGKPNHTKVVTLFASDGSSYTQTSFLVYTYDGGSDALSGKSLTVVYGSTVPSSSGATPWLSSNLVGTTTFASGANGLCVDVPLAGANFGGWTSPYGIIPLVRNNVYRVRIDVAAVPGVAQSTTPLWDFVFDNFKPGDPASQSKYSTDIINWDTFGGANAAGPTSGGRHVFDIWWAPLPLQAADWNDLTTGEFAPANDGLNDARLQYRMLDVSAVDAQNDAGNMCLRSTQVDRIDLADLTVAATPYDNQTLATNNIVIDTLFGIVPAAGARSTATFAGGNVTLAPVNPGVGSTPPNPPVDPGSWGVEILTISPGDSNIADGSKADNWPITWVSDQLLMLEAGAQAPNALGQSNPPDVLRLLMDSPTNEIGQDSLVSAGANLLGMPKTASETVYSAFYYTQNRTANVNAEYQALRPRFSVLCVDAVLSGGSNVNNGGIQVNFLRVKRIDVSGFN